MSTVDIVFVVLTYINHEDLEDFLMSLSCVQGTYGVVVVDSFHDEASSVKIENIAKGHGSDYIRIPNKGYSFGNNRGIEYALKNYRFEYLVVSNPDIQIEELRIEDLRQNTKAVIGASIVNLKGRKQNPVYIKKHELFQKMIYQGFKKDNKILLYAGILLNKVAKRVECGFKRTISPVDVFQLHGSFIIFPYKVIEKLGTVFDEQIFLFAEESFLALRLEKEGIRSIYDPRIHVKHKEDGSMQFSKGINRYLKEANIYVFEEYYRFK